MRFQERDGHILQQIHAHDGVLAARHIKRMFWADKSWRAMQRRLSKLFHHGYLARPSKRQWRTKPVPEAVYWLTWKGALWLANQGGLDVEAPKNEGENQMRKLQRSLRAHGFHWLREPRWIQLGHDLNVVDFRLAVEETVVSRPALTLEEWVPEGVFLSDADVIEYTVKVQDGEPKKQKKRVRPDGYFEIVDSRRLAEGRPGRARLLLEIDSGTHSNPKFGRAKAAPGAAYIESPEYAGRFGSNSGRWLIVTTGLRRMKHLMRQTQYEVGPAARYFFFTTFAHIDVGTVLAEPIWHQAGEDEAVALFSD